MRGRGLRSFPSPVQALLALAGLYVQRARRTPSQFTASTLKCCFRGRLNIACCKQDFGEPLEGNAEAEAYGADGGEDAGPGPGNASEDLGEDVHQEFVEDAASAGKQQPAAGAAPGAQAGPAGGGAAGGAANPQQAAIAEGGAPQNGTGRPQVPFPCICL